MKWCPGGRDMSCYVRQNTSRKVAILLVSDKLLTLMCTVCVCECSVPLVGMPIQLRYRVSFLDMYVLPRAGRPTITMTVGGLTKWGAPVAAERDDSRGYVMKSVLVYWLQQGQWTSWIYISCSASWEGSSSQRAGTNNPGSSRMELLKPLLLWLKSLFLPMLTHSQRARGCLLLPDSPFTSTPVPIDPLLHTLNQLTWASMSRFHLTKHCILYCNSSPQQFYITWWVSAGCPGFTQREDRWANIFSVSPANCE